MNEQGGAALNLAAGMQRRARREKELGLEEDFGIGKDGNFK